MIPVPPLPDEVTDADRAIHAKWKPVADDARAKCLRWLTANRYPWERIDQARARYSQRRTRALRDTIEAARRIVRRAPRLLPVWFHPLTAAEIEASDAIDRSAADLAGKR